MSDLPVSLPRYEEYKNSGVEWIGKIPAHWELSRLKNLAYINPTLVSLSRNLNKDVCFLPMERVFENGDVDYTLKKNIQSLLNGFTHFQKNDVIIAKITPCFENGKGACLNSMPTRLGFGSTEFHVLRSKNNSDPQFLYYLSKTWLFRKLGEKLMTGAAGQKRVPSNFLKNYPVTTPPINEQTKIVFFLTDKSKKIDQTISLKESQINLLKERKQILIQNAVTQGINPNAPMRDSGVEWIGDIPEHWGIRRLKYVLKERNERSVDGTGPLFMVSQVHGLVVRSEYHDKAEIAQTTVGNKIVYEDDLVFNKLKAHLGVFFKSNIKFTGLVSPDYAVYKSRGIIHDLKFLEYLFRLPEYIGQFTIRATGIVEGLIRLYTDDLFEIAIPIPPTHEQTEILAHIKKQSAKIDKAITLQQQMIDRLKEYKATLINSAVTGKIKVPEAGPEQETTMA